MKLLLLLALALPLPSSSFAFSSHTTRLKPLTLRSTNNFSTRTRSSLRSSYDDEDSSESSESSSTYFSSTFSSTPSTPATNPASSNDAPFDPTSYGDFGDHVPKLNSVTLVGRIGQTPNPRYFDNGNVVVNVSLAVTRKYHPLERKVRSIQYGSEETDWFPLEIWGRDAEYCAKFVKKGARVGISGQLCMQTWTDKQTGDERKTPRIVVKSIDILETKAEAGLREKNANRGPEENGFWEGGRQTNNDSNNDSNDFFE